MQSEGRPDLIPRRFSDLSSAGKVLVSTMRRVQFGRFEGLRIYNGDLIFDPPPRLVRVTKIGSSEKPEDSETDDWVLKAAVRDLFKEFARVQNGRIDRIVFHRGLPCLVEITIDAIESSPRSTLEGNL
jgi:hypothetical protein